MISVIRAGQLAEQQETGLPADKRTNQILPGVYDIRAEGDGMITEEKRGVHVFANRELDLIFVMHAGKGVHIMEYATGGLSREEVAARLEKLEAAVAQLQKLFLPNEVILFLQPAQGSRMPCPLRSQIPLHSASRSDGEVYGQDPAGWI